jgi:hypothetical protein
MICAVMAIYELYMIISMGLYIFWLVVSTPLKKYESQLGWLFPLDGKTNHVPNHQPVFKQVLNVISTINLFKD